MARKSRFYSITMRNGHGTWTSGPVPAASKDHAACYFETQDIKVIAKDYLGQCLVVTDTTPYDGVVFYATVGGQVIEFNSNCVGYNYLVELFHKQYAQGIDQLNDEHDY
ncbi:hypothetical protein E0E52_12450 [Azotobacter chroococcum]|uniref:hypothetical protein n=1 Tax=Azotobacter chroococcum TaxID=353 RepID=UPI00103EFA37|nr:hypothetical protein [Azotobacter chroococcum]TBW07220.1 hypothetical protein E0E52_12450 [Azotobacter chroococcum]